jgi:hypothetical protein
MDICINGKKVSPTMLRVVSATDEDVLECSIGVDVETVGDGSNTIGTKGILSIDISDLSRHTGLKEVKRRNPCSWWNGTSPNFSFRTAHVHWKL